MKVPIIPITTDILPIKFKHLFTSTSSDCSQFSGFPYGIEHVFNIEASQEYAPIANTIVGTKTITKDAKSNKYAKLTKLNDKQANYIGVKKEGPFKDDAYRY